MALARPALRTVYYVSQYYLCHYLSQYNPGLFQGLVENTSDFMVSCSHNGEVWLPTASVCVGGGRGGICVIVYVLGGEGGGCAHAHLYMLVCITERKRKQA